jgi:hypothetical protein
MRSASNVKPAGADRAVRDVRDVREAGMGHVFVLRGDLMQLVCDAWCVPGGRAPGVTWRPALPPRSRWEALPKKWGTAAGPRSALLHRAEAPEPLAFLTDIMGSRGDDPGWYVESARQFVQRAAETLQTHERPPVFGRARHLVALPLVGTGGGGGAHLSGEVMQLLLPAMREEAEAAGVDIALVLNDGPGWAAAQNARADDASWSALPAPLRKAADLLAEKARHGDLVVFLGAGVSQAAGLPSWSTLLADLAVECAHIEDDEEREAFGRLGELDRAAIIKRRTPGDEPLGAAVAQLLRARGRRHALAHALVAALPIEEVITTNYDDLFERASAAVERPCTVLPGGVVARGRRWLLKMHGCVTRPESIVLTREDYMKFQENRTALAGIVQALLLTRHMLFVGFSFTDDNFHRIAHAVRQSLAQQPREDPRFGTTLVVDTNPLAEELWGDDLDWISFEGSRADQARLVEIFLDRVAARAAAPTSHLGDRRYDGVLTAGERLLRDRIEAFVDEAGNDERDTAAWAEIARLLHRLGIKAEGPPRRR